MRSSNNELTVYRNETFAIDKTIQNKDGTPYVVSSDIRNPHILITVSSSKYDEKNRYKVNYLLSLSQLPRFKQTVPIYLNELMTAIDDGTGEKVPGVRYEDFPDTSLGDDGTFMTAYYKGKLVSFELNDAVFIKKTDSGIECKYWKLHDDESGHWVDYQFRFVKTFDKNDTSKWTEQTYYYSIQLVGGDISNGTEPCYDYVVPLLAPTKMSVLSNLEGGMM